MLAQHFSAGRASLDTFKVAFLVRYEHVSSHCFCDLEEVMSMNESVLVTFSQDSQQHLKQRSPGQIATQPEASRMADPAQVGVCRVQDN